MKKVLITGGCRGIGLAAARKFYENGFLTFITYNSTLSDQKEAKKLLPYATALRLDVTDSSQVDALFQRHDFDIVVNNAGTSLHALLTDTSDSDFDSIMRVNLYGTFYVCRAALPHMIKRQKGSIVNVSSIWALTGGAAECAYSAAKAGILGLTKALAKEAGPSNVRVNAVAPGFIDTKMTESISQGDRELFASNTPLMRTGTPEEVAEAIYFLGSDSSSFITGQVISPGGGYVI